MRPAVNHPGARAPVGGIATAAVRDPSSEDGVVTVGAVTVQLTTEWGETLQRCDDTNLEWSSRLGHGRVVGHWRGHRTRVRCSRRSRRDVRTPTGTARPG